MEEGGRDIGRDRRRLGVNYISLTRGTVTSVSKVAHPPLEIFTQLRVVVLVSYGCSRKLTQMY